MAVEDAAPGEHVSDEGDPRSEPNSLTKEAARDVAVVAKGGAVQIVGQVTQRSLSFFFTAVAQRVLATGGYGLYRVVAQVLALGGQIGLMGFNYASMRWISKARASNDPGGVKGAASVGITGSAIMSVIVAAAIVLLAPQIAPVFCDGKCDVSRFEQLLRVGALYVPFFAVMQVLRYCTQAYKTMVPSVVVGNIIQPAVRFLVGVAFLLAGFEIMGAVVTLVISMAVGAVSGWFYLRRMLRGEERTAAPVRRVGEMVRFAIPQAGSSLLGIQSLGLGIILLGILATDFQTGLFAVALSLQGPAGVFLSGIVNIWAPVVTDLYEKGEIERLGSLYQTITRWIVTFAFPISAAMILEPDLFLVFFGKDAASAAPIIAVLAAGNLFYSGTGPTGYVLSMTGRPGVNFINSIVGVALYIALGLWIVPKHGALGMAWVDAIVTALVNTARVIQAKILVGVQPFGRSFIKPVVATLVGAGVLLAWRLVPGDGYLIETAGVVIAAVVYIVVLGLFGIDEEERYVWDRIRQRALKRRAARP
jgi:O-antigen/teichoic acid export membrane protein